ncbi:MAG TPA: ROK family protein [Dehalococcoidia bacterium]
MKGDGTEPAQPLVVGVDLGGTKLSAALATRAGAVLRASTEPTPAEAGVEAVCGQLRSMVEGLLADAGADPADVGRLAMAVPGLVEHRTGVVLRAPNLAGWRNVPLRDRLRALFRCEVLLDNDAHLGALAEYLEGAGRGARNFVFIAVGTGIGGGLVLEGRLFRGSRGTAGEMGYAVIPGLDHPCAAEPGGCLGALVSGPAIAERAVARLAGGARSLIRRAVDGDLSRITGETVQEAARAGDPVAREVLREVGTALGVAIANLAYLLNPDVVCVGGGAAAAGDLILGPARAAVRERTYPEIGQVTRIVPAALGPEAVLRGAVLYAAFGDDLPPVPSEEEEAGEATA